MSKLTYENWQAEVAIIGGTGLDQFDALDVVEQQAIDTPYGKPSAPLTLARLAGREVIFLPRHGADHAVPPHFINYRANLSALKLVGVSRVIAVNAVGGIRQDLGPCQLCVPDQLVDYTYGREHTFFTGADAGLEHIDFTYPYTESLRQLLLSTAAYNGIELSGQATYGATQGPRLETAAEVLRLKRDGCDVVGMTGMPEAALARELELDYASLCLVVNWAAGLSEELVTMDIIVNNLQAGMGQVRTLLQHTLSS